MPDNLSWFWHLKHRSFNSFHSSTFLCSGVLLPFCERQTAAYCSARHYYIFVFIVSLSTDFRVLLRNFFFNRCLSLGHLDPFYFFQRDINTSCSWNCVLQLVWWLSVRVFPHKWVYYTMKTIFTAHIFSVFICLLLMVDAIMNALPITSFSSFRAMNLQ